MHPLFASCFLAIFELIALFVVDVLHCGQKVSDYSLHNHQYSYSLPMRLDFFVSVSINGIKYSMGDVIYDVNYCARGHPVYIIWW